jgi:hypothetical protein
MRNSRYLTWRWVCGILGFKRLTEISKNTLRCIRNTRLFVTHIIFHRIRNSVLEILYWRFGVGDSALIQCQRFGIGYSVLDIRHWIFGIGYSVLEIRYWRIGTRYSALEIRYCIFGTGDSALAIRCWKVSTRDSVLDIRHWRFGTGDSVLESRY